MTSSRRESIGIGQVLAAALLFSSGGAVIKSCSLDSWQTAGLRSGIAALVLWCLPSVRRSWTVRALPVAFAYAATMILFVFGNKYTTAANTIFLQSTAPLYVMLLAPWLLGERITRRDLWLMAALAGGLALFFVEQEAPRATAQRPALGNLLALLAGVTWALTVTGLRRIGRETQGRQNPGILAAALGSTVTFAICLPFSLPFAAVSPSDALTVGYLGVFQIGLAYVCLSRGLRQVQALRASLLLLLEPVLNPLWAWLVHGELPGSYAFAGAVVITIATALVAIPAPRRKSRAHSQ